MKILFLGESWEGSSARSLKEALRRIAKSESDEIDEINEDFYLPKARNSLLRVFHRLLAPAYRRELNQSVQSKCKTSPPDVLLVYKGFGVNKGLIDSVKKMGIFTVNVFPDYSPHAYGNRLRKTIAEYDLVISTKPFHPPLWNSLYGYNNQCVFVPHGYDPSVHLRTTPPTDFDFDLGLVATWRPEYHALMCEVARLLAPDKLRVAIAGNGWKDKVNEFPDNWVFSGEVLGAGYTSWIRRVKIVLAPVNRNVVINGQLQPGDEDTTRTYELAASYCFFIHRRTDYVQTVYKENVEVPYYENAQELAKLVRHFHARDEERRKMAAAAHARAVPYYSIDARARQVAAQIQTYAGLKNKLISDP